MTSRYLLICFFLLQFFLLNAQKPFISDYWYPVPLLVDSVAELELVATMGDSRWMHPKRVVAGDMRYAAEDSIILVGGSDYLTAWGAEKGELLWEYRFNHQKGRSNMIRTLKVCPSKPWVLAADDQNGLAIFNYYSGKKIKEFPSKADFCYGDISDDGRWVMLRESNHSWKIWEVETEKLVSSGMEGLAASCFMQDGLSVLMVRMGIKGTYILEAMDIQSGEAATLAEVGVAPNFCSNLVLSPDGKYLAVGFWGGSFTVLETKKWSVVYEAKIDQSWVDGLSWSSNGKKLLVVGASKLAIWRTKKQNKHQMLEDCESCTYEDGNWSKDSRHLLIACREWQRPRRLDPKKMCTDLFPTEMLPFAANQLAFSPDGKHLLTFKDNKGEALFINWKKQEIVARLSPPEATTGFQQVRFSPKGDKIAALPYVYPKVKHQVLYQFPSLNAGNAKVKGDDIIFMNGGRILVGIYFSQESVFDYQFDVVHLTKHKKPSATEIRKSFDASSMYLSHGLWASHSANTNHWLNTKLRSLLPSGGIISWYAAPSPILCEHKFGGFSEDMEYYGGIGNDGILYIYDRATGQPLAGKSLQGQDAWTAAISSNGEYIALVSWEGLLRVYRWNR